jgi:hypothetical protein
MFTHDWFSLTKLLLKSFYENLDKTVNFCQPSNLSKIKYLKQTFLTNDILLKNQNFRSNFPATKSAKIEENVSKAFC